MVFAIFERKTECMYAKKGDKTSFAVAAGDQNALPKYASRVSAQVEVDTDGWDIFIHKPKFLGEAGEIYFPENYKIVAISAFLSQVWVDQMKLEHYRGRSTGSAVSPDCWRASTERRHHPPLPRSQRTLSGLGGIRFGHHRQSDGQAAH